jgi:hypothetical protein
MNRRGFLGSLVALVTAPFLPAPKPTWAGYTPTYRQIAFHAGRRGGKTTFALTQRKIMARVRISREVLEEAARQPPGAIWREMLEADRRMIETARLDFQDIREKTSALL